jgi:hypothetical protein
MTSKTPRIELGIYAIVLDGNADFLKLNKTLLAFRYKLDIIPLDEFERKFKGFFDIGTSADALQNTPITFAVGTRRPKTIYISKPFFEKIFADYPQYHSILQAGYVVLLKTFKSVFLPNKEVIKPDEVRKDILKSYEFIGNFRKCLELALDKSFQLGDFFGYIIGQEAVIKYPKTDLFDTEIAGLF